MRKPLAVLALTLLHAALSMLALLSAFGASMARFDSGAAPTAGVRLLDGAVRVLHFPLVHASVHAPGRWFPGAWGYVPVLLNGALWALVLVYGAGWVRGRRHRGPAEPCSTPLP